MGYSRENQRQNTALQSILRGKTPEKRIFVANEDLEFKKKLKKEKEEERKRASEKLEITKEARVPWFCPKCDKVMKKRLDDRMWYLYNHCFECQIKIENKMRIDGTYDEWAEKKVIANKLAWIKEQKQSIEEFKKQDTVEFWQQFRPDGYSVDKEKWQIDVKEIKKQADEALEYLQKIEDSLK
jgi:Rps23 Pro-64 3,4-dihydroxylase Tpa1-like proline 4-hydroxylase|tara:strand:+ start:1035 stop:1583 length:549 start_codon:yes stop_codon:yes gene_type:complete